MILSAMTLFWASPKRPHTLMWDIHHLTGTSPLNRGSTPLDLLESRSLFFFTAFEEARLLWTFWSPFGPFFLLDSFWTFWSQGILLDLFLRRRDSFWTFWSQGVFLESFVRLLLDLLESMSPFGPSFFLLSRRRDSFWTFWSQGVFLESFVRHLRIYQSIGIYWHD